MDESEIVKHDLAAYIQDVNESLQRDYDTIRKRVKEDPGTAGDQVEETWASVLRNWLPGHYNVVTKGRIIGSNGEASPQIDVLVLWPSYPPFLLNKKMYLAAGVAAAFECKLTLKKEHLRKVFETAIALSRVSTKEHEDRVDAKKLHSSNFAYEEYHRVFEFGLLAHSFSGGNTEESAAMISAELTKLDSELVKHPNQMLDLLCVQGLGSWVSEREAVSDYIILDEEKKKIEKIGYYPYPRTGYDGLTIHTWAKSTSIHANFSPLGSLVSRLYRKLSRVDKSLFPLARFYTHALSTGRGGGGNRRVWFELPTKIEIVNDIETRRLGGTSTLFHEYAFFGW